eukprot:1925192-Prymnesium_polylepis.1
MNFSDDPTRNLATQRRANHHRRNSASFHEEGGRRAVRCGGRTTNGRPQRGSTADAPWRLPMPR